MKKLCLALLMLSLTASLQAQKKNSDKSEKSDKSKSTAVSAADQSASKPKAPIDFKVKPKVGALREVEFPHYSETTLKNGLKVFVIEDHKQPTISFRLQVGAGESMDGAKPGLSFLMSNLIYKGTQKRSAAQVANQVDSIGSTLNTSIAGELMTVSLDGLKKHQSLMLSIFSDVIQHPLFPKEELDKLMPQVFASIKQDRSTPSTLAASLSRMVIYGKDHPSALHKTEESVKKITLEEIRAFHEKYVRPNNKATLAIVGDVSMNEILPQLEKAFANWVPTTQQVSQLPAPKPMPRGVYFIQRPGSVQTSIMACAFAPGRKDENYEPLNLSASLLGSGFAGRLFKTLRETYSFTYTPYAGLTQGKYFNRFIAGADVRTAVTDSAIMILGREIAKVSAEAAPEDEFTIIRTNELGQYLMSFERSDFVASVIQNADYLGLSPEFVKGYAKRLESYSSFDVQRASMKYARPDQLYLVVVGSPEILPVLSKYGRVFNYNMDLQEVGDSMEKVDMSPEELMKKVQKAIGGSDAMNAVKTVKIHAQSSMSMGGKSIEGTNDRELKAPNSKHLLFKTPLFSQETWVNGTKAWMSQSGAPAEPLDEKILKSALAEAGLFYYAHLTELGYKCTIAGKLNGVIQMKTTTPDGNETNFYYDAKTFLLNRVEQIQQSENGPMTVTEWYEDYKSVGGVLLPHAERLELTNGPTINSKNSYEINPVLDDAIFSPKQ